MPNPNRITNKQQSIYNSQGYESKDLVKTYFAYNMLFSGVLTASLASVSMKINSDADFLVQALTATILDTFGGPVQNLNSTITLTLSNGISFTDQAVFISALFGGGGQSSGVGGSLPFLMPVPILLPANSVLNGNLTNNTGGTNTYMLTFHGRKIYQG